jgi:hypothetical protein
MITGTHTIIYSKDAEADKAFFRDILKLENVDVGRGYLMCDDINAFVKQMSQHKIVCSEVSDQRWGLLIEMTLPGGGKVGVYQPKHERPKTNLKMA